MGRGGGVGGGGGDEGGCACSNVQKHPSVAAALLCMCMARLCSAGPTAMRSTKAAGFSWPCKPHQGGRGAVAAGACPVCALTPLDQP
jgi:hypothetical protein